MRQWRLIYDCPTQGVWNMAVDEALLMSAGGPVLRLYSWEPACLSIGYGQRIADVDRARLAVAGWELVRRPTGGRAILHMDELTYSVILPIGHPLAAGDVIASYRRLSQALVMGLNQLVEAPTANEQPHGRSHAGPVCFETRSHYEVMLGGRKLVGSAQLRRKSGILQHGSIPLSGDIRQICEVLAYPDDDSRQAAQQQLHQRANTLNGVQWQVAADALVSGFISAFDIEFAPSELSLQERQKARELALTIYSNPAWTERR